MKHFPYTHWYYYVCIFLVISGSMMVTGCHQASVPDPPERSQTFTDELRINANKLAMQNEDQQIRQYIIAKDLPMLETGTGLRYLISEKGKGPKAKQGKIARIEYVTSLLTGELCYSSKWTGPKEFRIGSGGVESGLEEGILLLHKGDRVKFILPSHLAFGLVGNQDKIPGRCPLFYDVHLIDLK